MSSNPMKPEIRCVLCHSTVDVQVIGFSPGAARIFRDKFGQDPESYPQGVCERCKALPAEERKALVEMNLYQTISELMPWADKEQIADARAYARSLITPPRKSRTVW